MQVAPNPLRRNVPVLQLGHSSGCTTWRHMPPVFTSDVFLDDLFFVVP